MYSFCESLWAAPLAKWHIRRLTEAGKKLGGGIDTPSLCGHVKVGKGWDLEPDCELEFALRGRVCAKCCKAMGWEIDS